MNVITSVERWGDRHRPGFLDIFRIALGVFITYKGIMFITHMNQLENTTSGFNLWFAGAAMAHYIVFAHILAGPLIAFGLFTRIACLVQLPILAGAVILVNFPKGFLSLGNHMELEISLLVLVGLITFMIFGAGRFSVDARRRKDFEMIH